MDIENPIVSKQEFLGYYGNETPIVPLYPNPNPNIEPVINEEKNTPKILTLPSIEDKVKTLFVRQNNHIYGMSILSTFTVSGLFWINPPTIAYIIVLGAYLGITSIFTHFEGNKIINTLTQNHNAK